MIKNRKWNEDIFWPVAQIHFSKWVFDFRLLPMELKDRRGDIRYSELFNLRFNLSVPYVSMTFFYIFNCHFDMHIRL